MGFRAVRLKNRPGHQLVHDGMRSAIQFAPPSLPATRSRETAQGLSFQINVVVHQMILGWF
eukprot:5418271-Pyramimonas_sp.AAC.1